MIAFRDLPVRQRECLELCAQGLTDAEIGSRLHLSPQTVKTHLGRLREHWKAKNRTNLIHLGYQYGVLKVAETLPVRVGASPPERSPRKAATVLFEEVGMVHRAISPRMAADASPPEPAQAPVRIAAAPPKPTHILRVDHPSDLEQSWQIAVAAQDQADAQRRAKRLADWLAPPFRVSLTEAGRTDPLVTLDARGRAQSLDCR